MMTPTMTFRNCKTQPQYLVHGLMDRLKKAKAVELCAPPANEVATFKMLPHPHGSASMPRVKPDPIFWGSLKLQRVPYRNLLRYGCTIRKISVCCRFLSPFVAVSANNKGNRHRRNSNLNVVHGLTIIIASFSWSRDAHVHPLVLNECAAFARVEEQELGPTRDCKSNLRAENHCPASARVFLVFITRGAHAT